MQASVIEVTEDGPDGRVSIKVISCGTCNTVGANGSTTALNKCASWFIKPQATLVQRQQTFKKDII